MSDTEVGVLLNEPAPRDAIHIAVAPVIAAEHLRPGEAIGFDEPGNTEKVSSDAFEFIGIVDPFLKMNVKPGQRFWMFLYPRTITALRHQWTHPAFSDEVTVVRSKDASEAWLRDFVGRSNCPGYEEVVASALNEEGRLLFFDHDASGEVPPEFWDHIEVVTGRNVPMKDRVEYFRCSC